MAWGVVRTHGGEEARAEDNLRNQGYVTLLPRFRELVRKRGRWVQESPVLFPRYLFVEIEERWRSIFSTRGVAGMLMDGERPALLREGELERLGIGADGYVTLPDSMVSLVGRSVRVESGPFEGFEGLCTGMTGEQRGKVLLSLMGRKVPAQFDTVQLAVA